MYSFILFVSLLILGLVIILDDMVRDFLRIIKLRRKEGNNMPTCSFCGAKIKFMNCHGSNVVVERSPKFFRPDHGDDAEAFITSTGRRSRGVPVSYDGVKGYKLHICCR